MSDPNDISFIFGLFTGVGFSLTFASDTSKHISVGIIFLLLAIALALFN